jgi:hypothetical protein
MTVKLVLLKSGESIVSDIKEGFYEDKLVCYILEKPCTVSINGSYKILDDEDSGNRVSISLTNWPSLSKDTTIELIPDWIITMVDPKDELKEMYETQVLGIANETDKNISVTEQYDSDQSD